MSQLKGFILKFGPIYRFTSPVSFNMNFQGLVNSLGCDHLSNVNSRAVLGRKVSSLYHETFDDSMEGGALEVEG